MQNLQKYFGAFVEWCKRGYNINLLAIIIGVVLLFIPSHHAGILVLVSLAIIVISAVNAKAKYEYTTTHDETGTLCCPKCGSTDVNIQMFQENKSSRTVTKTKTTYEKKGHGCLYWLFIGWWFWIFDLMVWLLFTFPRLLIELNKKDKYVSNSKSVATTKNQYGYKRICVCQHCGHEWNS